MNTETLLVLPAERNAEELSLSRQPIENNWFVQLQRKLLAKAAQSKMDSCGCSSYSACTAEQTR